MTLSLDGLSVRYRDRMAVAPTSIDFAHGELVALVGPNGAGKSSLLKAIAGVVRSGGRIAWDGRDLARLEPRERARAVAYLPQDPVAHWPMRVRDLVALGRLPHRALGAPESAADRDAVEQALAATEVERLAERNVDELSGGERSRALLARALAVGAPVLVVDEPIASLDPYHQLQIMESLRAYVERGERASLVIAVLHDLQLAARFCSRVVLLDGGTVMRDGAPAQVLDAQALERHYRVAAYVATHDAQAVIVPWRRLG